MRLCSAAVAHAVLENICQRIFFRLLETSAAKGEQVMAKLAGGAVTNAIVLGPNREITFSCASKVWTFSEWVAESTKTSLTPF